MRALIILAALTIVAVTPLSATTGCASENTENRVLVTRFLARDAWSPDRQRLGLVGLTDANVRLLTDATDRTACERFVSLLGAPDGGPDWRWRAYRVGNYYFVALRRFLPDGSRRMGLSPLRVYDLNFNAVDAFAM